MRRAVVFLVVALVALAFRVGVFFEMRGDAMLSLHRSPVTDMHFFDVWAKRIAAGDWLLPKGMRPFAPDLPCRALALAKPGQACDEASADKLWDRWLGENALWQDPLYPWFVAAWYRLLVPDAALLQFVQGCLGVASAMLAAAIGVRLFGNVAGLLSGILAALYGPLLFWEQQLLRESLSVFFALSSCWLMMRAVDEPRRYAASLLAGMILGWGALLRGTGVFAAVATIAVTAALVAMGRDAAGLRRGTDERSRASWKPLLATLCLGFALGLAPWIARNALTGAPLTKSGATGALTFAIGNGALATTTSGYRSDDDIARILYLSDGDQLEGIRLGIEDRGGFVGWLGFVGQKALSFWNWRELPNNGNYYAFLERSTLARIFGVEWMLVAPLALVGLVLGWRRAPGLLLLLCWVLLAAAVCAVFYNVSRFRLSLALPLIPFAGYAPVALLAALREKRWGSLATSAVVMLVVFGLTLFSVETPPRELPLVQANDRLMNAQVALELAREAAAAGRPADAARTLEKELAMEPEGLRSIARVEKPAAPVERAAALANAFLPLHEEAAGVFAALGRADEAAEQKKLADGLRFFLAGAARRSGG